MTDDDIAIHFQQIVMNLVGLSDNDWIKALTYHTRELAAANNLTDWKLKVDQYTKTDTRDIYLLATKPNKKKLQVSGTITITHRNATERFW